MITLELALHQNQRGRGLWKLNTSFLNELEYVNEIKRTIEQVQEEYNDINPTLLWEMTKMKIRETSLTYASSKKTKLISHEQNLELRMKYLQEVIDKTNSDEVQKCNAAKEYDKCKTQMEKIIEYRTKGTIIRSKSRWYNEGEKNTKYFLNLEKRHYKNGTITSLKNQNGDTVISDKEILKECKNFFNDLYSSKINIKNFIEDKTFFKTASQIALNIEQKEICEGQLNIRECLKSLKTMEKNKTPGTDGLPAEFYKVFWNDVSGLLVNSLNYAYLSGRLSITQRRGIIKLIPKKDSELYNVKNWRPISLLNCDYKIAAKSIANRMKNCLPNLINNDQTGFLKGRYIGENIRLIDSIISYAADKNIPGLLLFLDFEKAFDTLEWPFIRKTLQHYGFGPSLIKWFDTFYCDTESCIINNGWTSTFFKMERGVRQGCPLSPYLFIIAVEVLASAIREHKNLTGFTIDGNQIKLSQYADDTTLILNGSETSLVTALQLLKDFGEISGLKLNMKKTEALWIGCKTGNQTKLCPYIEEFKWVQNKVKTLGVWLSTDNKLTFQ